MEKRIERIGLSLLLVLALVSSANATLSWSLVDENGGNIEIDDIVLITVSSDAEEEITWGVYLDPTSEYTAGNAQLQNATVLVAAGNQRSVTGDDPGAGHDYTSAASGQTLPSTGAWSTVQFVGLVADTYTVDLTNGGSGGTELLTAELTVVPEPATIALLGLGGMFLLRRRRR